MKDPDSKQPIELVTDHLGQDYCERMDHPEPTAPICAHEFHLCGLINKHVTG